MCCQAWIGRSVRCAGATAFACGLLHLDGGAQAETIHVPLDHATIQEAILAAADGDEIEVAAGEYHEAIDFIGKAIRVYAANPGDYATLITSDGWRSVVTLASGEGPDSILEGFTLYFGGGNPEGLDLLGGGVFIRASSPTIRDCYLVANGGSRGGGMYIEGGSPVIENCDLEENGQSAGLGGGFYIGPGSAPRIRNCFLGGNLATAGGGLYCVESAPVLERCVLAGNRGHGTGPSLGNGGGGLYGRDADLLAVDCVFVGNSAGLHNDGGASYAVGGSLTIIGSTFVRNEAHAPFGDPSFGGAMFNDGARVTLLNCAFGENEAVPGDGGALFSIASEIEIVNSTFHGNLAGDGVGGGMCNTGGTTVHVVNSILWGDGGGELVNLDTSVTRVEYSDVQGGHAGAGNIDVDPKFADAPQGNYALRAISPCIDAGANNAVPTDAWDLDHDGDLLERTPLDFFLSPRFADRPETADTGCGAPVVVDMGFHEYVGDAVHPVRPGDVDGDGIVGIGDLLEVLGDWGPGPAGCRPADVDFDQIVGFDDLLAVLAGWG